MSNLWFWYLAGALLTLAWKWQRYCYEQKGAGNPPTTFWQASREWFELETFNSKVSWIATIGAVWVIGVCYIEKIGFSWFLGASTIEGLPTHIAFAFLLGALAELFAPALLKWVASKIPGLSNGK